MNDSPTPMADHILHPSGGLIWHWRALRERHTWWPLIHALRDWINVWSARLPPSRRSLALIGPSAGWTLPLSTLQGFDSIVAFEPDICARVLLPARLRHPHLRFDATNIFSDAGRDYFRQHYSKHAVLFCNALGQLTPDDDSAAQRWCTSLRDMLAGMHWASYHDWISTRQPADDHTTARHFAANTPIEVVLQEFWRDNEIDIFDHLTHSLAKDIPFDCIPWRLRKNQWHLIKWISQFPAIPDALSDDPLPR